MDITQTINLEIGYGIGSVSVLDTINKKYYVETFPARIPFLYLWFSKRAEKRVIDKAMKFISNKTFEQHQKMMK